MLSLVLAQCFVISDPTPGWKQVTLPADAPQLAAPDGYPQLRTDEPVTLVHDTGAVLRSTRRSSLGTFEFELALPANARALRVQFSRPLESARVDVVLEGPRGRMAVLSDKRVAGNALTVAVSLPDATTATVAVHSHLRSAPTLEQAEAESVMMPGHAAALPPQLTLKHSLYVLKPAGPLVLCQRPGQPLRLDARSLLTVGDVASVALTREPS